MADTDRLDRWWIHTVVCFFSNRMLASFHVLPSMMCFRDSPLSVSALRRQTQTRQSVHFRRKRNIFSQVGWVAVSVSVRSEQRSSVKSKQNLLAFLNRRDNIQTQTLLYFFFYIFYHGCVAFSRSASLRVWTLGRQGGRGERGRGGIFLPGIKERSEEGK